MCTVGPVLDVGRGRGRPGEGVERAPCARGHAAAHGGVQGGKLVQDWRDKVPATGGLVVALAAGRSSEVCRDVGGQVER